MFVETNVPPALVLMLHEGGWDEVLMVAVGLGVAYLIILWSGRRKGDEDAEDDDEFDDGDDADVGVPGNGQPSRAEASTGTDGPQDRTGR